MSVPMFIPPVPVESAPMIIGPVVCAAVVDPQPMNNGPDVNELPIFKEFF